MSYGHVYVYVIYKLYAYAMCIFLFVYMCIQYLFCVCNNTLIYVSRLNDGSTISYMYCIYIVFQSLTLDNILLENKIASKHDLLPLSPYLRFGACVNFLGHHTLYAAGNQ